jgi:hypothetical protein
MLPCLTLDQLNRKEQNGSTCLHVACHRNHFNIALILVSCGCDRNVKNKFGLTPLEETTCEKIRSLFSYDRTFLNSLCNTLYSALESDDYAPNNKFLMGHVSVDNVYEAKEMVKAYRSTGIKKMYMIKQVTTESYVQLRKIVNRCIPPEDTCRSEAIEYLDKQDPFALIKLYTLETGFYRYLQNDNAAFTANIFINLAKFQNRAFKGRTYRGAKMAHFDIKAWDWATKKPGRIIETQTFMSTSELEQVAKNFAEQSPLSENKMKVLFIFDFPETCDTAIKLTKDESKNIKEDLTTIPSEKEVLVTPYTLFEVASVSFNDDTKWYRIHLTNIPIRM